MLMFLYNIAMTIRKSGRFTTTEGVLIGGLGLAALLYLPALLEYENYTVAIFTAGGRFICGSRACGK